MATKACFIFLKKLLLLKKGYFLTKWAKQVNFFLREPQRFERKNFKKHQSKLILLKHEAFR